MAPKSSWSKSKPNKHTTELSGSGFPSLKSPSPAPESEYKQIQEDELFVLKAIYGDDYQDQDTSAGAWKKSEPSFRIRISSSIEDLTVVLHAVFTATYPKSLPLLSLTLGDGLREGTKFKLQKSVETKAREMVIERPMEPMILEISVALKDILEEAAEAKAAGRELPSLEEERAMHEAAAARKAAEEEEQRAALERKALVAEEEKLNADAQVLVARREKNDQKYRRKSKDAGDELTSEDFSDEDKERVSFDEPITLVDERDNERAFHAVTGYYRIRQGPVSECFTARPVMKGRSAQLLVLKKTIVRSPEDKKTEFRDNLEALEREISKVMTANSENVMRIYAFKFAKQGSANILSDGPWTVSILMEYGNKGSLEECLDISGGLTPPRVKAWSMKLLDALEFLHSQGIIHRDLHASNILLVRNALGAVTPKIADAGFQRRLHELNKAYDLGNIGFARSVYWVPPENVNNDRSQYTEKTDVWDFGIIFLQMIWGLGIMGDFTAPQRIPEEQVLTKSLEDLIRKVFLSDPKKRLRVNDLKRSSFFAGDDPIEDETSMHVSKSGSKLSTGVLGRPRHGSMVDHRPLHYSRYQEDFVQEGRLGKGGFGEVLKARKKLDGQFYAVKRITQKSTTSLEEIIREVQFLSALRHPYIVQYHNSWTEYISDASDGEVSTDLEASTVEPTTGALPPEKGPVIEFGTSTGGLDFISSSRYIQFNDDDDDDESDEGKHRSSVTCSDDSADESDDDEEAIIDEEESSIRSPQIRKKGRNLALTRTRSDSRPPGITVLYIQIEYCEGKTLRDVIKRGSLLDNVEEIWRLLRQLLEALQYLHTNNVVHRDLKPENVFIDGASNIRIGDFGLATSGQYHMLQMAEMNLGTHDMTTNIGTASYVAPEVMLGADYTSKVDLYSLGIILFEMCYHPIIGMERAVVLRELRDPKVKLPDDFDHINMGQLADIIRSLLNHNPNERPSSSSLLKGGRLPVQMGSEAIQQALASLQDPKSPYYPKMMAALYSRPTDPARDMAWDMIIKKPPDPVETVIRNNVKEQLISIFRRHGALEAPRLVIFPRSTHYGSDAVQLLEPGGALVQLRYDMTLPYARAIAKNPPKIPRSYAFGDVYRDKSGGQPLSFGEVNFDIVSDSLDLALKEAEVIKTLDEIITFFPCFANAPMCFHVNHSELLNIVFDHCRVALSCRLGAAEALSKLGVSQWTWPRIKIELRSNGLSAASIDELSSFNFRASPESMDERLKLLFQGTEMYEKASTSIAHLKDVAKYARQFGVKSKIYVTPLGSVRERYYKGGVLFSYVHDRERKEVFAAGGRYDSLIREFKPKLTRSSEVCHAVGFSFGWDNLAQSMLSFYQNSRKKKSKKPSEHQVVPTTWLGKRCDVLVSSFDAQTLRSAGVGMLNDLWRNEISAELACDARSPEDLLSKYKDESNSWIVTIKQDSMVKIKTVGKDKIDDIDLPVGQVVSWLKGQIRDRDQREGSYVSSKATRHGSLGDDSFPLTPNAKQSVTILQPDKKGRKNIGLRDTIHNNALRAATGLAQDLLRESPILAIESMDDKIFFRIRGCPLSYTEKWKQLEQESGDKRYIQQIHGQLKGFQHSHYADKRPRDIFVFNSRSGSIFLFDVCH